MEPSLKRRELLAGAGLLMTGALAGCSAPLGTGESAAEAIPGVGVVSGGVDREASSVPPWVVERLVRDNARFALDLHEQLVSETDRPNLLTSPYSVSVVLAMTYAGARQETADQMASALSFDVEELHPAFNTLDRTVDPPGGATGTTTTTAGGPRGDERLPFRLNTVNAVWGQEGFPWREAYLEELARYYGAGLHTVDFRANHERARELVNRWVAARTDDEIVELFPPDSLGATTRMVLTNAVHFQANWATEFDEAQTEPAPFTTLGGSTTEVPMMRLEGQRLPNAELGDTQVIELPYVGDTVGLVVLVPPEGELEAFERDLDTDTLFEAFQRLTSSDGTLRLPRFAFESAISLPEALEALGMEAPFDPNRADLRGMYRAEEAGQELFLGDVRHRTAIEVDEHGTSAAAASGVQVQMLSASMDPYEVTVDRPFLFCIRHRPTDAVLFLGRVGDAGAS